MALILTFLPILVGCGEEEGTKVPVDTVPPAPILDLSVTNPSGRHVELSWTAPGDDGMEGTAANYDIRYLPRPITEQVWDSAAAASSPPTPKSAGELERCQLDPLPDGQWYFAIKARDDASNWSELSNVVQTSVEDLVAPEAVDDLTVVSQTAHGAVLVWTAPGNDGEHGTAVTYDLRYDVNTITEDTWPNASRVEGVGPPQEAGRQETSTVEGLETGQTYYFALKTADGEPNWSPISNVAQAVILDNTPPAPITDLHAVNVTTSSVRLAWTAPGGDGNLGTANRYDLRYSTDLIDEDTWEAAAQAERPPAPRPAGTAQTYTIGSLEFGTQYYFAIRAEDADANVSDLSNVVDAITEVVIDVRRLTTSSGPVSIGAFDPAWSPDGEQIAFRADWDRPGRLGFDLYTIPLDGGPPIRLTEDLSLTSSEPSWSPSGAHIVYSSGPPGPGAKPPSLWIMNSADGFGKTTLATAPDGGVTGSTWSPDGTRIAFAVRIGQGETGRIYSIPAGGGALTDLTGAGSWNASPAWSPDGSQIALSSDLSGSIEVWLMNSVDGQKSQLTHSGLGYSGDPTWSPDGSRVAFASRVGGSGLPDIWIISTDGSNLRQLTTAPGYDAQPAWSPDGSRIAFTSDRSGTYEIWILELGAHADHHGASRRSLTHR